MYLIWWKHSKPVYILRRLYSFQAMCNFFAEHGVDTAQLVDWLRCSGLVAFLTSDHCEDTDGWIMTQVLQSANFLVRRRHLFFFFSLIVFFSLSWICISCYYVLVVAARPHIFEYICVCLHQLERFGAKYVISAPLFCWRHFNIIIL